MSRLKFAGFIKLLIADSRALDDSGCQLWKHHSVILPIGQMLRIEGAIFTSNCMHEYDQATPVYP